MILQPMMQHAGRWAIGVSLLATALIAGCQRGSIVGSGDGPDAEELAAYYSPRSITILPFTKPRSFDDDVIPDGLGVSLRPLDSAGDPVKAYGSFLFELYAYRPAISHHRGELLQTWERPIRTIDDQKDFWERVTSTYEFHLSWEGAPLTPEQRYILVASFQAPGSERLFDEYEFEFRVVREEIAEALSQQTPR